MLEKTPQSNAARPVLAVCGDFVLAHTVSHSESFDGQSAIVCVAAGVGLSGGRGRLLTHVHRASACTLNAVGLLPVSGCGDARVAPPCPTTLCVWRNLEYLASFTLPYAASSVWVTGHQNIQTPGS